MRGITGYKLKLRIQDRFQQLGDDLPPSLENAEARNRVVAKMRELGQGFFDMSEDEYHTWADLVPEDEFVELIALMISLATEQSNGAPVAAA